MRGAQSSGAWLGRAWLVATSVIAAAAGFGRGAPPESGGDTTHLFFRGKLLAAYFTYDRPAGVDAPARPALQFRVLEEFTPAFAIPGRPVTAATLAREVDLDAIDSTNYDQLIRSLLPADVRFGDECLVEVAWKDLNRTVVSLYRSTADARLEFLRARFDRVYDTNATPLHRGLDESLKRTDRVLKRAAEQRTSATEATNEKDKLDRRAAAHVALATEKKQLHAELALLQAAARRLALVRDAGTDEQRANIDALLATMPAIEDKANRHFELLDAAIAADPFDASHPESASTGPPALKP